MTDPSLPQSLDDLAPWIKRALSRGAADPRSPFRWPTLATVDDTGQPQQRTLVLREARPDESRLIFYTDRRTPKVVEAHGNSHAALHIYDPKKRVQLRLSGVAEIVLEGPAWDKAWTRTKEGRVLDYAAETIPGTPIADPMDVGTQPTLASENFALLIFYYQLADFLSLGRDQHLRARVNFSVEPAQATWLVP